MEKEANFSALSNTLRPDFPGGTLLGRVATAAGPRAALSGVDGTELRLGVGGGSELVLALRCGSEPS